MFDLSYASNIKLIQILLAVFDMTGTTLEGNAEKMENYLIKSFLSFQEMYEVIGKVGGKGLLILLDLVHYENPKEGNANLASVVLTYCLGNGLSLKLVDAHLKADIGHQQEGY